jgi:hypothetical protein
LTRFSKHISLILLLAFSVYVLPKELVHEFFHHDTEDAILTHGTETTVGNAHEHCDLLELNSPPFQQSVTAFTFYVECCCFSYALQQDNFHPKDLTDRVYLRGPPMI